MSTAGLLIGTGAAALVATTGAAYAPDLIDAATAMTTGSGLVTETTVLAYALGTEGEQPRTLTCVPDAVDPAARPCARFAEYDFALLGEYAYRLAWDGPDFVLTGSSVDGQVVVFDAASGGVTDTHGTRLPQTTDLDALTPTEVDADREAGLDALTDWVQDVLP
ncbi:MAG: hypothetical protein Q8Q02_16825 [Nocardioides sp.]|nr:hypothetical protein [Nocardioides sp.]